MLLSSSLLSLNFFNCNIQYTNALAQNTIKTQDIVLDNHQLSSSIVLNLSKVKEKNQLKNLV